MCLALSVLELQPKQKPDREKVRKCDVFTRKSMCMFLVLTLMTDLFAWRLLLLS